MSLLPPAAYRADWIFPVAEPPIRDGIIEVGAGGTITSLRCGRDHDAVDLGAVAIVPALINPHVHLEFSDLAAPIGPSNPFPAWLKQVVAYRRGRTQPLDAVLQRGLDELRTSGVTAFGEISTGEASRVYETGGMAAVIFHELIGPIEEQWSDVLAAAERHLGAVRLPGAIAGLSPHAPYTVPQELFERSVQLASRSGAPVAVHLAETASERELLASRSGELVDMLESLNLWHRDLHPAGRRPLDWLELLSHAPRGLVIHGNYLERDELDFIASQAGLTLVYCPRTHAGFGHPPHPFRRVLEQGGRVALATDGRSSNPDLDLWREAVSLRRQHVDLPSDTILDLVTRQAAESLGIGDRHGVLAAGRSADFLAVPIRGEASHAAPDLFALESTVRRVFRAGVEDTPCGPGRSKPA